MVTRWSSRTLDLTTPGPLSNSGNAKHAGGTSGPHIHHPRNPCHRRPPSRRRLSQMWPRRRQDPWRMRPNLWSRPHPLTQNRRPSFHPKKRRERSLRSPSRAGARIPLNVRKWLTSGKYLNKLFAFGPGLNPEPNIGFGARGAPLNASAGCQGMGAMAHGSVVVVYSMTSAASFGGTTCQVGRSHVC